MSQKIDVYYSFRSPYSYLATHRLREISQRWDVDISIRIVLPIAVRTPEFFKRVNPLWPPYLMKDVLRIGEYLGVPFRWPRPDPVVMDLETMTIPTEQPYIWRISRLGVAAEEAGAGLAFTCEAALEIWGGEVDGWHEGTHLADAAKRAGLDFAELEATAAAEPDRLDAIIEANQDALQEAGHWGVPTCVIEGEPYFGQDRLDMVEWRLGELGVSKR